MSSHDEEPKQSIFRQFLNEIVNDQQEFIHTEITELKTVIFSFLDRNKGSIREQDRKKMILTVQNEQSLLKLQQYIFNSLLIYEGLGVIQPIPR